ncbi:MAG: hypothetical protein JW909_11850 [Planctomycetes bacterium]|nr:hypothetical protein [Planctomycetota bacterium]
MDSRERVFLALEHQEPDRVPRDFWASPGAWDLLLSAFHGDREDFLAAHGVDFRYIDGPLYAGPPLPPGTDMWGVRRRRIDVPTAHGSESYMENDGFPLAGVLSPGDVDSHPCWPDPGDFDYSVVRAQAQRVRNAGRVAVFMGDRLNRIAQLKPAMYMRGVEQILVDLAVNPDIARAVFARLSAFYSEYLDRILSAAAGLIDIVLTGDDFGQQEGTLLSPAMFDDFLAPGFRRYMDVIHSHGVLSMHHTCGDVRSLVGRLQELGLDILQSLQPEAMEDFFPQMKASFGGSMSFQGGISIQRTMPSGTRDDVFSEVRRRVDVLAPGGGYIFCTAHNIQSDCSRENILSLLDAYAALGSYASGA